jgi:hypothetical protein
VRLFRCSSVLLFNGVVSALALGYNRAKEKMLRGSTDPHCHPEPAIRY